nr:venom acid phosphatase Acph-1-like [Onthophagus taurus]
MSHSDTLVLVHVLYRHGERTTAKGGIYPKDPHRFVNYEPYGFGQLTNEGKKTMFELGNVLRERYSNFLGDRYFPGLLEALSSDMDRTKVSLQLVLASLFKPTKNEIWNEDLCWQPIPTRYIPLKQDDLFLPFLTTTYRELYKTNHLTSQKAKQIFEDYQDVFQILWEKTGLEISTIHDVFKIHDVLTTEVQFGLDLPDWAKPLHTTKIREIATFDPEMQQDTKELKKLAVGKMIGKICEDTQKKIQDETSKIKMHMYSGHDINLGNILQALGLRKPHLPNYGACLVMEIHKLDGDYVLKVFYRSDKNQDFTHLGFDFGEFMEFDAFKKLSNEINLI